MIEASKTAELSSQPTKRGRRAWLIALAVVVAVVTIALLANAPKPEPVKVWFVRATNEAGEKRLVFEGANGLPRKIRLGACIEMGETRDADYRDDPLQVSTAALVEPEAGTSLRFSLPAPTNNGPYYVEWTFYDNLRPRTRWETSRMECAAFFSRHKLKALAWRFYVLPKLQYIPSTEIKE